MTEYKLVVVGGKQEDHSLSIMSILLFSIFITAGGVGKSALTIQLIQNQ
jgi:hypothetical protein